jgi:hypothetical protein
MNIRGQNLTDTSETNTDTYSPHPLTKKFLEDGPLNPYFHIRWNPKTGRVEPMTANKPKKKKKLKKKIVLEDLVDDESSSQEKKETLVDPLAFLNPKKKLGGVVDLALQKRDSLVPPIMSSSPFPALSGGDSNGGKDDLSPISLPQISSTSMRGVVSPLSTQRTIPQVSSTDQQQQQALFYQLYSMINEIDDITHPKHFPVGMTKEEKNSWTRQTEERKVNLVRQCEEIA